MGPGFRLGLARSQALRALRCWKLAELHRLLNMPEEGNAANVRDSITRAGPRGRDDVTNVGRRRSGSTATLPGHGTKTFNKTFLPKRVSGGTSNLYMDLSITCLKRMLLGGIPLHLAHDLPWRGSGVYKEAIALPTSSESPCIEDSGGGAKYVVFVVQSYCTHL